MRFSTKLFYSILLHDICNEEYRGRVNIHIVGSQISNISTGNLDLILVILMLVFVKVITLK